MTKQMTTNKVSAERLYELDKKHYFHPTTPLSLQQAIGPSVIFEKGEGIRITDVNGVEYIDGVSSLWNVNLGYGRQELADAASEQMMKLAYASSFFNNSHDVVIRLSEKLAKLAPGDLDVSFFTSGGSESNESAFKIVRHYWKLKGQPQRSKIISLDQSYHGVTMGTTSATGVPEFKEMITAIAPDFLHAIPYKTNCELGDKTDPDYARSFRGIIEKEGPENVAAIILEPIQGVGGVNIPPEGYLQALRDLCDEHGIFMITDEVITGFGRTGEMFGVNHWNVVPDIMCVAKGITGGYIQLGAVMMTEKLRDEISEMSDDVFYHGFTYSGHPTACAVALKTIEIIERDGLVENAKLRGEELLKGLKELESKHKITAKARGIGLMAAIELFRDPEKNVPFEASEMAAMAVVEECAKRNLILRPLVFGGLNAVALAPPLIATKQDIEDILSILSEAISAFEEQVL